MGLWDCMRLKQMDNYCSPNCLKKGVNVLNIKIGTVNANSDVSTYINLKYKSNSEFLLNRVKFVVWL